jgi:hypothetical protein
MFILSLTISINPMIPQCSTRAAAARRRFDAQQKAQRKAKRSTKNSNKASPKSTKNSNKASPKPEIPDAAIRVLQAKNLKVSSSGPCISPNNNAVESFVSVFNAGTHNGLIHDCGPMALLQSTTLSGTATWQDPDVMRRGALYNLLNNNTGEQGRNMFEFVVANSTTLPEGMEEGEAACFFEDLRPDNARDVALWDLLRSETYKNMLVRRTPLTTGILALMARLGGMGGISFFRLQDGVAVCCLNVAHDGPSDAPHVNLLHANHDHWELMLMLDGSGNLTN